MVNERTAGSALDSAALEGAAAAIRAGLVVAIPTDTVYGLAVDARIPGATARLFSVKGRPESTALPVLVASFAHAETLGVFNDNAVELVTRHWPGGLTIVVPRRPGVSIDLGGDPATIGLRWPAHVIACQLFDATGPLAVTSANRHGEPPCHAVADVTAIFGDLVLAIDGGLCDGAPSTVVSIVDEQVRVLRQGAVDIGGHG